MSGRGGTRATDLLTTLGIGHTIHRYAHDPRHPSYGQEASEALGVPPGRVFKTLIAEVDGKLTVAVVPVSGTLDLKRWPRRQAGRRRPWPSRPPPSVRLATSRAVSPRSACAGRCRW